MNRGRVGRTGRWTALEIFRTVSRSVSESVTSQREEILNSLELSLLGNGKFTALENTPDKELNRPDAYGEVALRLAIRCGRLDLCKSLVKRGAQVTDVESNCCWTLLHAASAKGSRDIVAFLLIKGAMRQINAQNNRGDTPCHLAAKCGFTPVVKLLVKSGADITIKNWRGRNVREEAMANRQLRTVSSVEQLCYMQHET
ncbi:26S proteasome non-ATPase regulatory subunit 10-like [Corticium candelabrum]|uniref:26S proteasome non-ATPase regulatory subunit 10-like n=1 Tax=Corticium candelabrum TaxID=121492 RepID=UPI002E258C38|nr:26S proteasome non-ATPase regulatory subunit 10-like [Corticium candelabrum]